MLFAQPLIDPASKPDRSETLPGDPQYVIEMENEAARPLPPGDANSIVSTTGRPESWPLKAKPSGRAPPGLDRPSAHPPFCGPAALAFRCGFESQQAWTRSRDSF